MPAPSAKQVEAAVDAAIDRKDYDAAARVAAGHPDPLKRGELDARIALLRAWPRPPGDAAPEPAQPPEVAPLTRGPRMFELRSFPAKLSSFNPRAEIHGAETKPAADLKFECNVASTALDAFDPGLRGALYHKADGVAHDLADEAHDAPDLRFPKLVAPLKWSAKFAGYELRIHLGIDERSHVVIGSCDLNAIQFSPQQGGTVVLGFRVQCHPGEHECGRLAMLVQTSVDISLTPPEDGGEVPDDDDGGEV